MDSASSGQEVRFFAQHELLSTVLPEIKPLLEEHWKELARNQETIKLEPDFSKYLSMEKAGMYRLYTVRKTPDGELVGYAGFIVAPHLHYLSHLWALADLFYVRPQFRSKRKLGLGWKNRPKGAGSVLFDFVETDMRQMSVSVIHCTHKIAVPMAGKMFAKRGYQLIEYGWAKSLI